MGGSESSSEVIYNFNESITNNIEVFGETLNTQNCTIRSVVINANHCAVNIENKCKSNSKVTAKNVFDEMSDIMISTETEQIQGSLNFMDSVDSTTSTTINEYFENNISTGC